MSALPPKADIRTLQTTRPLRARSRHCAPRSADSFRNRKAGRGGPHPASLPSTRQWLVANTTRAEDDITAWRHNTLADHATVIRIGVIMIPMMVAAIPVRTDADTGAKRANLYAYTLRVCRR